MDTGRFQLLLSFVGISCKRLIRCKFGGYQQVFTKPSICPAFKKKCSTGSKEGHFAKMCPNKGKRESNINAVEHELASNDQVPEEKATSHLYFGSIELASIVNKHSGVKKNLISLKVAQKDVKFKADTRVEATVIPFDVYKSITTKPLQIIYQPLKGWLANKPVHPVGCVKLPVQYKHHKMDVMFLVVHGNFTPFLSCNTCIDLEVLKFMNLDMLEVPEAKEKQKGNDNIIKSEFFENDVVLSKYRDCFSLKPGTLPVKVHLEIDESIPAVYHPPRKIPVAFLGPTKQKLLDMESDGIIIKEDEHTPWVSSMVVVDKRKETNRDSSPTKDSIRICIDLNRALKRPHYPMVTVEQVADRLTRDTTFTTLDASSGYWQLPVDEDSSKLLTFNTPWGRYRFTRLPFGIS